MKIRIALTVLCVALSATAQTSSNKQASAKAFLLFSSHSKTIEAYRIVFPQLTNMPDERLVLAMGEKHPELLQSDGVFSNEFVYCVKNFSGMKQPKSKSTDEPITEIITLDDKHYTQVKIKKIEPDGLVISYGGSALSICKVYFESLPDDIKERFHYDRESAIRFQSQQVQSAAELRRELIENGHIEALNENKRITEGLQQRQLEENQRLNTQLALAKQKAAEAQQRAADAAMIEALKPPAQINVQQNTFIRRY